MNGLQFNPENASSGLGRVPMEEQYVYRDAQWIDVIPVPDLSQRQVQAIKRLIEVLSLSENWDSYGSPPPNLNSVDVAIILLTKIDLDDIPIPHIVPVSGGGIQLEWSAAARELELEISHDGLVQYMKTEHGEPLEEGPTESVAHARSLLTWLIPNAPIA